MVLSLFLTRRKGTMPQRGLRQHGLSLVTNSAEKAIVLAWKCTARLHPPRWVTRFVPVSGPQRMSKVYHVSSGFTVPTLVPRQAIFTQPPRGSCPIIFRSSVYLSRQFSHQHEDMYTRNEQKEIIHTHVHLVLPVMPDAVMAMCRCWKTLIKSTICAGRDANHPDTVMRLQKQRLRFVYITFRATSHTRIWNALWCASLQSQS